MSKRFIIILKVLFVLFLFSISFIYTIKWLDKINLSVGEENIEKLIDNSSSMSSDSIIDNLVEYFIKLDLFDPIGILNSNYGGLIVYSDNNNSIVTSGYLVNKASANKNKVDESIKPKVYIYNTHPSETYADSNYQEYNITPTVVTANYIFKDKLSLYGIDSIIEKNSVQSILDINGWNYASSYRVTRMFLEQAKLDYPSFDYFVDIHRDSVNRKISTIDINGKSYAKIMFLVGLENPNYKQNLLLMTRLNEMIIKEYPGISRGIYKKGGAGVNGIYNQDFSKNCILIEIGGMENNIEEVTNTIEAFVKIFSEYIGVTNG